MKNNLLKKFVLFSYGNWVGLIIGVLTTMVTTRILSPENFGKSSMFNTVLNFLITLIVFGTDQSFVRFFYEESCDKRGGLLYNCIKIPFLFGIIVFTLIVVFYKEISTFIFDEKNYVMALILALDVLLQSVFQYSNLVIRMQQKGNLYSIIAILRKIFDFVLLLTFYGIMGDKYEVIIFSSVITSFLLTVFSISKEKEYWSIKNYRIGGLKHNKKEIFTYAYPLVFTSLIFWLFTSFDKFAIRQWSTMLELGIYSAASKIVALLTVLQGSFTTFWTPICYEHYEKFPKDKYFYETMCKIITILMFSLSIISITCKDLISYLLGPAYREAANVMPFLVFMPIMYTLSETTVIGINFVKRPKWHILIASISCVLNIIGNSILVPVFGAKGAAISTAFSYIIFFSLRTFISLRFYRVDYGLLKLYIMLIIISIYALYATFVASFLNNLLVGIMMFCVLILLYFNNIKVVYQNYVKDVISDVFDSVKRKIIRGGK